MEYGRMGAGPRIRMPTMEPETGGFGDGCHWNL